MKQQRSSRNHRQLKNNNPDRKVEENFPTISNTTESNHSLILETLHPKAVYVARNFLSVKECERLIKFIECQNEQKKLDYVSHPANRFIAHRECFRYQRNDWTTSHNIFERMKSILDQLDFGFAPNMKPITCNGNIRLYKYSQGMRFGRHIDESNKTEKGQTQVTILIYLSDCQGGATRFYRSRRDSFTFSPIVGAILLHVHGDKCLEHEGDPVEKGIKYILRTDMIYDKSS